MHDGATLPAVMVDAGNAEPRGDGGFSQTPFMQDVERWGAITINTGLGNTRFTNLQ